MNRLPLEGMRVIEMGQIVAGPAAGLILGDLGADVIKVEPPGAGGPTRPGNQRNGSFFFLNRNKRAIVLDLHSPEGHKIAMKLIGGADVLIENMAPGTMDRLGLGFAKLHADFPRLVYCSIKGYLSGPYQSRPLMDEPGQMAAGLAFMTGPPGQPLRAGASVVDIGAASFALIAVMSALLEREKTGVGQHVTGGLFETALFYVGQHMAASQLTGKPPQPMTVQRGEVRPAIYDLFTCRDGRQVFIGIVSDGQWKRVCSVLELEDLAEDPRYRHNPGRLENRALLMERIGQACAKRDSRDVVEMIVSADVIGAPLNTPMTVLDDPHVQAEGRTLKLKIGDHDGRLPPLPIETNTFDFGVRYSAPKDAGIHTRGVLSELGYTSDEIEAFARDGIVSGPDLPAKSGGGSR